MDDVASIDLQSALAGFEGTAANFSVRFIPDAMVRAEYNQHVKAFSKELLSEVSSNKITPSQAAAKAAEMRNTLMDAMRGKTSEIAKAYAFSIKTQGKSLPYLESKYAKQLFSKPFESLNGSQKNKIWKEIVFSSGRPQLKANNLAKTMGRAGRSFIALTIALSVYNIATAEDKLLASAKRKCSYWRRFAWVCGRRCGSRLGLWAWCSCMCWNRSFCWGRNVCYWR